MLFSQCNRINLWLYLFQIILVCFVTRCKGQNDTLTLKSPAAGNCGEVTELNCLHTDPNCNLWIYEKDGNKIFSSDSTESTKYKGSSAKLVIKSTTLDDAGKYQCYCNSKGSNIIELHYECKPTRVTSFVTQSKKLSISVDPVYPYQHISVSLKNKTLSGTPVCDLSPTLTYHFICNWTSHFSLEDVDANFIFFITTVTETKLYGHVKIATPGRPSIVEQKQLPDGRIAIHKTEGYQTNLECVSRGGIPAPTVVWYKNSIQTSPLNTHSSVVQQSDGTYTVTVTYTVTPQRSDDRKTYICRSYYPQVFSHNARGSRENTAMMYLNLKPDQPIVTQINKPVSGENVILECRTSGGRPAPDITWTFGQDTYTPQAQSSPDATSETYSVVSTLHRTVTLNDNGQQATCHVTHAATSSELTNSVNVMVWLYTSTPGQPSIDGQEKLPNGTLILRKTEDSTASLVCVSSGGYPSPTVEWYRDSTSTVPLNSKRSVVLRNDNTYVVTVMYTFIPRRSDDRKTFICRSYYPQALNYRTQGSWETPIMLYLYLKPNQPEVIQTNKPLSGQYVQLECGTSGGRPAPSVTWVFSSVQTLRPTVDFIPDRTTGTFGVVSKLRGRVYKSDNGKLARCNVRHMATNLTLTNTVKINVNYPPQIQPLANIAVDEGQVDVVLPCIVSSNPVSKITWYKKYRYNLVTGDGINTGDGYNSLNYTLVKVKISSGGIYRCHAENGIGKPDDKALQLTVRYSPWIYRMTDMTVDEGQVDVVLTCKVSSNPVSQITWYHPNEKNYPVEGDAIHTADNSLTYTLTTVSRQDNGSYLCHAENGIGSSDEKIVQLSVRYVTVTTGKYVNKTWVWCNIVHFRRRYRQGSWVQVWPGYGEVKRREFLRMLTLLQPTYEYSGVYICRVKSKDEGAIYVHGNTTVFIKSPPVLLEPVTSHTNRHMIEGILKQNTTLSIKYYSNVPNSVVSCYHSRNRTRSSTPVGTVVLSNVTVQLPVFSHTVPTPGTMADVIIMLDSEADFGDYDIVISNDIGSGSILHISILPHGPPETPRLLPIKSYGTNTASVEWVPGFHGGLDQTFVIQISQDEMTWSNKTEVSGGQNLTTPFRKTLEGLTPSTKYYVRMFSYNGEGWSAVYSTVFNFSTINSKETDSPPLVLIGSVAGAATFIIIVVVIVVTIIIKRRKSSNEKETSGSTNRGADHSTGYNYVTENAMYISSDDVEPPAFASASWGAAEKGNATGVDPSDMYAVPDKSKKAATDPSALYAVPDKSRKAWAESTDLYAVPDKSRKDTPSCDVYAVPDKAMKTDKNMSKSRGQKRKC